jgi:hypothetical protein
MEVFQVWVQLEPPSRRYPAGKTALGHYTITDGILTLTDQKGQGGRGSRGPDIHREA